MSSEPKMAVETTRELLNKIVAAGADKDQLLSLCGIDEACLAVCDSRYSVAKHIRLFEVGEQLLNLADIGLQMGCRSDPYSRGIVGLIFSASQDLQQAIENKIRYTKILADHISLDFACQTETFSITYSILEGYFHRYEIERVFGGFLNWVRIFIGKKINPLQLTFQYAQPGHIESYRRHFQCPMAFDQATNTITLPLAILQHRHVQYNSYLYQVLKEHADNVLSKVDVAVDFVDEVRGMIAGRLCHGNFAVEDIAASLKISKRTLNRKLSDMDANYQGILDDVRKEMAISYLKQGQCATQTIPCLLGYADPRGFLRAFKRWTGVSPKQYLA